MTSPLFEPLAIAGMRLKNRLARAATAEAMATDDGRPTPRLKALYGELAQNETGLIITSGATIEAWPHPPSSIGLRAPLAMHHDGFMADWADIIEAVHRAGAGIAMQIGHLGRQDPPALRGSAPLAPSPVPLPGNGAIPAEITPAQIDDLLNKFAAASRRVEQAGFDAVEFHGAHGNLIGNFMSPFTNRRKDAWGGASANRARFAVEALQRSRQLVGPDFPIMLKLSFSDFVAGGLVAEEAVEMAALMVEAGANAIEVSGGTLSESPECIARKDIRASGEEAYFRHFARALKAAVGAPVILVGGIRSPRVAEEVLQGGEADLVALCRPLIRQPDLFRRWREGSREKATCLSCNQCFANWMFRPTRCYLDHPLGRD